MRDTLMRKLHLLILTAVSVHATGSAASAQDILVLGPGVSNSFLADVENVLSTSGSFTSVASYNLAAAPTLVFLQGFDGVLLFSDGGPSFDNDAYGDVLADYVDGGGAVVDAVFSRQPSVSLSVGGRWLSSAYSALTATGQTQGIRETLGPILIPGHPIMSGVSTFDGGVQSFQDASPGVNPGAAVVAQWSDGFTPLVAVSATPGVVSLGFFPPSDAARSDLWSRSSDGGRLMVNALEFAIGAQTSLSLSGTCPLLTVVYEGGTPFGPVAFVTGPTDAGSVIPAGGCAGSLLGVAPPNLQAILTLDGTGTIAVSAPIPPSWCGSVYLQAVDLTSCRVSNLVQF